MAKSSFASQIIVNYKKIITVLQKRGLIRHYNELSEKINSRQKHLEYCTRNEKSNCLFDSSLSAVELYDRLIENNQYNIEFSDGSIFLFMCTIEGKSIIKQRIVYIKLFSQLLENFEQNNTWEEYQMDDGVGNIMSFPVLIRIDYDIKEKKIDHPISHVTLSNIENFRLPAKGNIGFDRFIELVLHQIYNLYDIVIPKIDTDITIKQSEKEQIHINWI